MGIKIWCEAKDIPGNVCSDARLRGGQSSSVSYPKGATYGQAGWEFGFRFDSLADLANKLYLKPLKMPSHLPALRKGSVSRLGIHAHGLPGAVFFEGQNKKKDALTMKSLMRFNSHLRNVGASTAQDATILFVGCLAGKGWEGRQLLEALSKVWPGRKVVAFTTIGFVSGGDQMRPGERCTEPGMRDTDNTSPVLSWADQQKAYGPIWKDLQKLPWASETSPHAKVAFNGKIIRKPKYENDDPPKKMHYLPAWLDKELYQAWQHVKKLAKDPGARAGPKKRELILAQARLQTLIEERRRKGLHYKFPDEKGYLDQT